MSEEIEGEEVGGRRPAWVWGRPAPHLGCLPSPFSIVDNGMQVIRRLPPRVLFRWQVVVEVVQACM